MQKMPKLLITILGEQGAGKTRLANKLPQIIEELGICNAVDVLNLDESAVPAEIENSDSAYVIIQTRNPLQQAEDK